MTLEDLGWSPEFGVCFDGLDMPGLIPARVARQHAHSYLVMTAEGQWSARLAGRLRPGGPDGGDLPVVGDWVAVAPLPDPEAGLIQALLPRQSGFTRQRAGAATGAHVVAANIDVVFVVTGLDDDFNLRRLERYLTLSGNSGATPVVLLNKSDICDDPEDRAAAAEGVAPGVAVHALSAREGDGFEAVEGYLRPGRTVAFIGSSGAGKSTIVNRLAGAELMAVGEVRSDDDRGRHTTTHRELIPLPGRGVVIDTPGMRELQMWGDEETLRGAFADIEALAGDCRFRDCAHASEPGCAVRRALDTGDLDADRFRSYLKLKGELARAAARRDQAAKREERLRARKLGKLYRDTARHSRRRKGG